MDAAPEENESVAGRVRRGDVRRSRATRSPAGGALLILLALTAVLVGPPPADAESWISRTGSEVGGFLRRVMTSFLPAAFGLDDGLERTTRAYAEGRHFTTYREAARLAARGDAVLADEARLLAGLAAGDASLRDEAVRQLTAVLDAESPSPYYPVALAALLDLEARLGNSGSGFAAAYFADFWDQPRSAHEASVKAIFLETGNLSPVPQLVLEKYPEDDELRFREDRPVDRAVHLAGMALLREKDWQRAAICFEALTPRSVYFPYARYSLAQARFGLGQLADATRELELAHNYADAGERREELFLKDRAAVLQAQLLHELGRDSAAIHWLGRVRTGPFALHAALLAAEIHTARKETALALLSLETRPAQPVEPKLMALAAALDAALHRDLEDPRTAVAKLDRGLGVLVSYAARLDDLAFAESDLASLLDPLDHQARARERIDRWRRENVAHAIPGLVDATCEAGRDAEAVSVWMSSTPGANAYLVPYRALSYDPFSALAPPAEAAVEASGDELFPALLRRSLGKPLGEALRYQHGLTAALDGADSFHLALAALDGELRLAALPGGDTEPLSMALESLGLGDAIEHELRARPRAEVLLAAVTMADPEVVAASSSAVREAARETLDRWRDHQRDLLRLALAEEEKLVQELRLTLDQDLAQALAGKQEQERRALWGQDVLDLGSATAAFEPPPPAVPQPTLDDRRSE